MKRKPLLAALALAGLAAGLLALPTDAAPKTPPAEPRWIWTAGDPDRQQAAFFRKEFTVRGRVSSAKLFATCDNRLTVFVNGVKVAQGNDWTRPVFADVREHIKGGKNVIAVRGQNAGGPAGLVLRLDLKTIDMDPYSVVTDDTWRVTDRARRGWHGRKFDARSWDDATELARLGAGPWKSITPKSLVSVKLVNPKPTEFTTLTVKDGFRVETVYNVPKATQGSWVSMCVDPQGRLIVSDQYGSLYRVTPSPVGGKPESTKVEQVPVKMGFAQGLLCAFDSLYVMVNSYVKEPVSGLYRVTDSDGDGMWDTKKLIRKLDGRGEHGPHAILLSPDGKSLHVMAGNHTALPKMDAHSQKPVWGEDHLLPRMWDAKGHARGKLAPGGWIAKIDPDGENWELISSGYRNAYDAAFNKDGELFTYDSDMEWDMNTPWYRPTRVLHATGGSEFGWRSGTGKWPTYYPDSLPPVVDVGQGSPTGVTFGYGAKFPKKYRDALYVCDWSYGKLYAVHLKENGASYTGELEEFVTGTPLPLTDIVVNPKDGAMYFTLGGRRVTSGLYRVVYTGEVPKLETVSKANGVDARSTRRMFEAMQADPAKASIDEIFRGLNRDDRFIRYAARVALEHQPAAKWQQRALAAEEPRVAIEALLALTRVGDKSLKGKVLDSLLEVQWDHLSRSQKLSLLRVIDLCLIRMGGASAEERARLIARFDPVYPAGDRDLDAELAELLIHLQAPSAAEKTVTLMTTALTRQQELDYALMLRNLKAGWTPALREAYFKWFVKAGAYTGGASFQGFLRNIKNEAVVALPAAERERLKPILEAKPPKRTAVQAAPRKFVKKWTMAELVPAVEEKLTGRDFAKGKRMFAAAQCYACHRYGNEGGATGPDLTGVAGRFSRKDLLQTIIEPNHTISDQYAAVNIVTSDGRVMTGRIVNLFGDAISLNTDMLDPNALVRIDRDRILQMKTSPVSMMPEGLLDTLNEKEVLDLMAYLLSRGDAKSPMFKK